MAAMLHGLFVEADISQSRDFYIAELNMYVLRK